MNDRKMLRVGLGGAAVSLLCCFTPILVILVAGVGLSVVIGWLDHILFPLFFTFMGVAAYALYLRAGRTGPTPTLMILVAVGGFSALIVWLEFNYALRLSFAAAAALAAYGYYLHRKRGGTPASPAETPT